jgi:predicted RND superfamily exporter protein
MGMGIAIDFGIQTVSRYKEERQNYGIEKSIEKIIEGVFKPMTIALVAAIIGFTALSFGRITFLSDLGTMLTFTTLFAYIGALTLIPVLLVLYDKYGDKYIPDNLYEKILR